MTTVTRYVCLRCGIPLLETGNGWKHLGHHTCGKAPRRVLRTEYEAQLTALAAKTTTNRVGRARLELFNNRQESFASRKQRGTTDADQPEKENEDDEAEEDCGTSRHDGRSGNRR